MVTEVFEEDVRGLSPALVGLVLGVSAAIPLYLWQMNVQIAVASFVIVGYTAWLWAHSFNHATYQAALGSELRRLPVNMLGRRILRLVLDPGFWWTMLFGGILVSGSVWYAGLKDMTTVGGLGGAWGVIALCMSYGFTLVHPVTRCRRCGYDLSAHVAADQTSRVIRCPECAARWNRWQLAGGTPIPTGVPSKRAA